MLKDIKDFELLASIRIADLSALTDLYFKFASDLQSTNRLNYISRASFILEQLNGGDSKILFERHREEWEYGILRKMFWASKILKEVFYRASDTAQLPGGIAKKQKPGF